ncbi:MAG: hypothetical protein U9Q96_01525 [Patescibacteria group bacterium]|nr:hypothetical protein [Patescibacteria group bacterium]
MELPLKRFTIQEIMRELKQAEREKRTADFSNKLLPEFSFSNREINVSLNFQNSSIQGALYLDNCKINGDVNLENTLLYTTLYISKTKINGNFIAKKIKIREIINFVASSFNKGVDLQDATIKGFLGLNKVFVKENLDASRAIIKNIKTATGTIRGDVYLLKAKIEGSVIMEELSAEGLGNFEETAISKKLILKNSQFQGVVILSGTIIEGEVDAEGMQCENLIAHMT